MGKTKETKEEKTLYVLVETWQRETMELKTSFNKKECIEEMEKRLKDSVGEETYNSKEDIGDSWDETESGAWSNGGDSDSDIDWEILEIQVPVEEEKKPEKQEPSDCIFAWTKDMQAPDELIQKASKAFEDNYASLTNQVAVEIMNDGDDNTKRLYDTYSRSSDHEKQVIDATLVYLTGYGLKSLIENLLDAEEDEDEEEAA